MIESLAAGLETSLSGLSPLAVLLAFAGGALTGLNPCAWPTVPVVLGLIGSPDAERPRWRAPAIAATFVLGLGLTYAVIGLLFGTVGRVLGLSTATWHYLVAVVCLVFGLSWAGVVSINFTTLAPGMKYWPKADGFAGALVLGMLFGLVASPCATPVLAVILSAAAAQASPAFGAVLLLAYAVGHGLPLLILGCAAGAAGRLQMLGPAMARLQQVSGWALVAVAFYLVWTA